MLLSECAEEFLPLNLTVASLLISIVWDFILFILYTLNKNSLLKISISLYNLSCLKKVFGHLETKQLNHVLLL